MAISNISTGYNGDAVSCSLALTSGSGNNRIVVGLATQTRNPPSIAGMTYNGVSGTQLFSTTDGTTTRVIAFYWLDANLPSSAGTYTLATTGAGIDIGISGLSCDGAAQNAPADSDSTFGTANNTSLALTASGSGIVFVQCGANATMTANGGQTTVLPSTNSGNFFHGSSYDTTDGNVGYTFPNTNYVIGAVAIEPASAGTGLTITSVTPSSFDDGHTGIVIAGSGFGSSQGASTLKIGAQAQTVTAWSDTSITFTCVRGANSMGANTVVLTKA